MNNRASCLEALKLDKEGECNSAHALVDQLGGEDAARVHAYLHRKEGDPRNANDWYRRAGQTSFKGALQEEWQQLWDTFSN